MGEKEIQQEIKNRQINHLMHFTRLENLESILNCGLHSLNKMDELGLEYISNDQLRLDNFPNSISVSISFPNHLMFYKYRQQADTKWIVIIIDPKILWVKDCAFCKHNAADNRIRSEQIDNFKSVEAFQSMFKEIDGLKSREEQNLDPNDTTDPQAEVLVFDNIETNHFIGVVLDDKTLARNLQNTYSTTRFFYNANNKGVFASRNYVLNFENR